MSVTTVYDSKGLVGQKRCKCNSTSHLRTNHSECPLNPKRKRNTSAVSSHTVSCDREQTSPTRVTSRPQDEAPSESNQEETSPTRGVCPPPSEASSDLECMDTSDVCDSESENSSDSPNQTLNQTLKWRSSVSPKHCLYALVLPLVLDKFPIDGTVPATPEMLPCKVQPPQDLPTQLQVHSPWWNGRTLL